MELTDKLNMILYELNDEFTITGDDKSLNHNFEILDSAVYALQNQQKNITKAIKELQESGANPEKIKELQEELAKKQDELTAGYGIIISDDGRISVNIQSCDCSNGVIANTNPVGEMSNLEAMKRNQDLLEDSVIQIGNDKYIISDEKKSELDIPLDNGKYAQVVNKEDGVYDIGSYGVKADGSNISEDLQKIANNIPENSTIKLPAGDYAIERPVILPESVTLEGNDAKIELKGNSKDPMLDFSEADEAKIKGIEFVGANESNEINAIKLPDNAIIEDCKFDNIGGVAIDASENSKINDCNFENVGTAIVLDGNSNNINNISVKNSNNAIIIKTENNIVTDVRLQGLVNAIIMENDSNNNIVENFNISDCSFAGIILHGHNNIIRGIISDVGNKVSLATFDMELNGKDACAIYMQDDNKKTTYNNKVDAIINAVAGNPQICMYMNGGENLNNDITLNTIGIAESTDYLNPLANILSGRENDIVKAFYSGTICYNGVEYYIPEKTSYPFNANFIFRNNYLVGYDRTVEGWSDAPRAGLFMNYFWENDFYMSVYNARSNKIEWMKINPIELDTRLMTAGKAADALAVGTIDAQIKSQLQNLVNRVNALEAKHEVNNKETN